MLKNSKFSIKCLIFVINFEFQFIIIIMLISAFFTICLILTVWQSAHISTFEPIYHTFTLW